MHLHLSIFRSVNHRRTRGPVLNGPHIAIRLFGYSQAAWATQHGWITITFFVPAALKTLFNLGAMQAADVISAAYITAIFANLLFGYIADRLNRFTVMIIIAALLIPASLAMMSSNLLLFRIGAAILVAAGLSATNQGYANAGAVLPKRETGPPMGIISLGAAPARRGRSVAGIESARRGRLPLCRA
jgi:MFS family permease